MARPIKDAQDLPVKVFVDTEFTDLLGITQDPALISIGFITEDGKRTFYAELTDTYTLKQCSDFVRAWVVPLLDASELSDQLDHSSIYARMTASQCRELLAKWLELAGNRTELWSDAPSYDWHFVVELFHDQIWPKGLDHAPISCVPKEEPLRSLYLRHVEKKYSSRQYRRHHALDDARVNREGWLKVNE